MSLIQHNMVSTIKKKRREPLHISIIFTDDVSRKLRKLLSQLIKSRRSLLAAPQLLQSATTSTSSSTSTTSLPEIFDEKLDLSLPSTEQVRVCRLDEYKAIALSLAHSFLDDPVSRYFLDTADTTHWTPAEKWSLHLGIMESIVYAHLLDGLVTTIGTSYGAVALWLPPGKDADSTSTMLRSGMWRLRYRLSRIGRQRFFAHFLPLLHDTKARVLGEQRDADSWYLVYLGTRPEARRKGYARALIEDVTTAADREGKACYLESSKEMNVQIYEKFGFERMSTIALEQPEGEGVPLEIMVREPKV